LASFTGAKNGGDNWNYKMCKAAVKSLPSTYQHPAFYRPDALPFALKRNSAALISDHLLT